MAPHGGIAMKTETERPIGGIGGLMRDSEFFTRRKIRFLGSKARMWHSLAEVLFIDQILTASNFDTVIELGAGRGGVTTLFLVHALRVNGHVYAFDTQHEPGSGLYRKLKKLTRSVHHEMDVFSGEAHALISDYVGRGRVLLYCDNGNKRREFNTYAPLLKGDDVVMAHDKGQEIFWSEISDTANACGFTPFHQDLADRMGAGIFSFIKQV